MEDERDSRKMAKNIKRIWWKRTGIVFRYFDLGIDGEKIYHRDKYHYIVEPVSLVFNEDNYYMVAYSARDDDTANYRIDHM